jgi:chromosome segregation ATPase
MPRMDKDALRRQLDDMEEQSERWRAERRRMQAEIDKLENALADNRPAPSRKRGNAGENAQPAIDPNIFAKLQEAADEKVEAARQEWEAERAKLLSQINRLEGSVAEAIERASNPMRSTQSVKEQFEIQLNRALKEKTEIEQAFLRAKTQWEQEKLKTTGEMVKLRRAAQIMGRPIPKDDTPEVNPKVLDLENQLRNKLAEWNTERGFLNGQIQTLQQASRQWDTERRQLNDHAGQLQQAFVQAQAKIQTLEIAARTVNPSEAQLDDTKREKESLQRQFQDSKNSWDSERRRLNSELERLEQQLQRTSDKRERLSNEAVDQLRHQYEQRLQEAIQQKTQLAEELQTASSKLELERTRLSAPHQGTGSGVDAEAIAAEVSRVEGLLTQIIAIIDDPDTELSTVIRKNVEKAELDSYLKGILFALGKK